MKKKYDLEKILPHSHPMILIDEIVEVNFEKKYLTALVKISEDKIFYDKTIGGISPMLGIEFMAQAIGCYAHLKRESRKPKIGFLLGARLYDNAIKYFENKKKYTIKVTEIFTDDKIVSFDCLIYNDENSECACATVNVYQPDDDEKLLIG